jgi:hypothetical protein
MRRERRGRGRPWERDGQRRRGALGALRLALALSALLAGARAVRAEPPPASADELQLRELESRISRLPQAVLELGPPREAAPPPLPPVPESLPDALAPDEVRYVPLPRAEEQRTRELAAEQLQVSQPEGDVALFRGAIRARGGASAALTLKAVAFGGEPLRYRVQSGRFEGSIRVGVVELGGSGGAARPLPAPVIFQVIGPVAAPASVEVRSTAPPYQDIAIAADSPADTIDLRIVSNVSPEGALLRVLVQPALFVRSTPSRIQGFGLETTRILVSARGLGAGGPRRVQLGTDLGHVEPVELELSAEGTATSELRSASIGRAALVASGASFADGRAEVQFVFPLRFLVAALLGGLAGGALRRSTRPRERRQALARELGIAVLCGQLVFALYALGVNLVGVQLPAVAGELLVFAVCALGALLGSELLRATSSALLARLARP